jgi:hypothetical protein
MAAVLARIDDRRETLRWRGESAAFGGCRDGGHQLESNSRAGAANWLPAWEAGVRAWGSGVSRETSCDAGTGTSQLGRLRTRASGIHGLRSLDAKGRRSTAPGRRPQLALARYVPSSTPPCSNRRRFGRAGCSALWSAPTRGSGVAVSCGRLRPPPRAPCEGLRTRGYLGTQASTAHGHREPTRGSDHARIPTTRGYRPRADTDHARIPTTRADTEPRADIERARVAEAAPTPGRRTNVGPASSLLRPAIRERVADPACRNFKFGISNGCTGEAGGGASRRPGSQRPGLSRATRR